MYTSTSKLHLRCGFAQESAFLLFVDLPLTTHRNCGAVRTNIIHFERTRRARPHKRYARTVVTVLIVNSAPTKH